MSIHHDRRSDYEFEAIRFENRPHHCQADHRSRPLFLFELPYTAAGIPGPRVSQTIDGRILNADHSRHRSTIFEDTFTSCWNTPGARYQNMSEASSEIPFDDDYIDDSDDNVTSRTLASTFRAYQYRYNRRFHEDQKGSQYFLLNVSAASNAYHLD